MTLTFFLSKLLKNKQINVKYKNKSTIKLFLRIYLT
jgi:hypothetical protein